MRRLFILLFSVFLAISGFSQGSPLKIVSFHKVPNDIVDLVELKNKAGRDCDFDSNKAALIRVKAQGFTEKTMLDFSVYPKPGIEIIYKEFKDGEMWLYVSSKCMGTIVFKYMGEFEFALPNKLEPKAGYELTLGMETATLVIRTIPLEADIFVDNEKVGKGEAICAVSIGSEHRYRVACDGYYSMENVISFDKSGRKEISIELNSNCGYITVKSEPNGAEVYVDKVKVGVTPYMAEVITAGQHRVEIKKNGYYATAEIVTINVGEHNKELEKVKLEKIENYEPVTLAKPENNVAFTIKDVVFANTDYDGNIIDEFGSRLIASKLQYLKPKITYECNDPNLKKVELYSKIKNSNGVLKTGSSSPDGYTQKIDVEVSQGTNTRRIMGWGNRNGGIYSAGKYTYELWYDGKLMISREVTVYDEFRITDIIFANVDYDGNIIDEYGSTLYASKLQYLKPKITYDCLNPDLKQVELYIKIKKSDGSLKTGSSSPEGYTQKLDVNVSYGENKRYILGGWGNSKANHYQAGSHIYEVWYKDRVFYSKSFYVH